MKKLIVLLAVISVFSITGFADIPPYKPTPILTPKEKSVNVEMNIRLKQNISETTLEIPKSLVKDLRAALENIDEESNTTTITNSNFMRTQTLMGGFLMSSAMIFGGIWLFRAKPTNKTVKIAAGLIISAMIGASATILFAITPPPPFVGINSGVFSNKMQNHWYGASGKVKVILNESDNNRKGEIILTVPRNSDSEKNEE